jgi:predicted nucleic acid-binding protein
LIRKRTFIDAGVLIAAARGDEVEFYEAFFDSVSWIDDLAGIVKAGNTIACSFGLDAMDSLHVAAAIMSGSEELVTTERASKPIHRVRGICVTSIHSDS